ncbi:hypothetical protein D3C71_1306740 [compost metagenome]
MRVHLPGPVVGIGRRIAIGVRLRLVLGSVAFKALQQQSGRQAAQHRLQARFNGLRHRAVMRAQLGQAFIHGGLGRQMHHTAVAGEHRSHRFGVIQTQPQRIVFNGLQVAPQQSTWLRVAAVRRIDVGNALDRRIQRLPGFTQQRLPRLRIQGAQGHFKALHQ